MLIKSSMKKALTHVVLDQGNFAIGAYVVGLLLMVPRSRLDHDHFAPARDVTARNHGGHFHGLHDAVHLLHHAPDLTVGPRWKAGQHHGVVLVVHHSGNPERD